MEDSEWREIPGFEKYLVNIHGEIKRKGGQVLTKDLSFGYPVVRITSVLKVHRAVMLAFGAEPKDESYTIIRHLDGDRNNHSLSNLAWGTYKDNSADSKRHGTHHRPGQKGEKNPSAKLTAEDVVIIRTRAKTEKIKEIWTDYQFISYTALQKIVRGEKWSHVKAEPVFKNSRKTSL